MALLCTVLFIYADGTALKFRRKLQARFPHVLFHAIMKDGRLATLFFISAFTQTTEVYLRVLKKLTELLPRCFEALLGLLTDDDATCTYTT